MVKNLSLGPLCCEFWKNIYIYFWILEEPKKRPSFEYTDNDAWYFWQKCPIGHSWHTRWRFIFYSNPIISRFLTNFFSLIMSLYQGMNLNSSVKRGIDKQPNKLRLSCRMERCSKQITRLPTNQDTHSDQEVPCPTNQDRSFSEDGPCGRPMRTRSPSEPAAPRLGLLEPQAMESDPCCSII